MIERRECERVHQWSRMPPESFSCNPATINVLHHEWHTSGRKQAHVHFNTTLQAVFVYVIYK